MKEKNNPPFFVGQKVVAVKDSPLRLYKKGYVCEVLIFHPETPADYAGFTPKENPAKRFLCANFAPLDEPRERIRYIAVSESLREKAQEVVVESVTSN